MVTTSLSTLNDKQREAVTTTDGYVRIIAGAGSGKTKTLVSRYAYLVNELNIDPANILCITFTNKAAQEMRKRVCEMVFSENAGAYISTYHGLCVKILREDIQKLLYPKSFTIMDEDDKKSILKEIYEELGLSKSDYTYKKIADAISRYKRTSDYITKYISIVNQELQNVFESSEDSIEWACFVKYLQKQRKGFYLDFDDLIFFALYLLQAYQEVASKWQNRLRYIMVDETQDNSKTQWVLVNILQGLHKNLFVVGDPDQCIYEWRGANPNDLIAFEEKYTPCKTIILNQNYRSTPNILGAANVVIANNSMRIEKDLYSHRTELSNVTHFHGKNEYEEGDFIARTIIDAVENGAQLSDCAVLYRASYMSRFIEQALIRHNLDYVVFGGVRFFERREIKDTLSYLRMVDGGDDISFNRTINLPSRKLGKVFITNLKEYAQREQKTLYETLKLHIDNPLFNKQGAKEYIEIVEESREKAISYTISDLAQYILDRTKLTEAYRKDEDEERLENIQELMDSIILYQSNNAEEEDLGLNKYLQDIALYTNLDHKEGGERIKIMTIHQSKGLEFPIVFVAGMYEGIFPSIRTIRERRKNGLEEERRLAYVAITRAEDHLYLTESEGYSVQNSCDKYPSRFITEIGSEFLIQQGSLSKELERQADSYKQSIDNILLRDDNRDDEITDDLDSESELLNIIEIPKHTMGDLIVKPTQNNAPIIEDTQAKGKVIVDDNRLANQKTEKQTIERVKTIRHMESALQRRVEIWKKQLLDLGKRNRLVNFKEGKRNNVKITAPSIDELYNLIVVNERGMSFPYTKSVMIDDDGEENYGATIEGDIETSRSVGDLQKTLRALRLKAKTSIEEQGINVLYLTFGSVEWKESDASNVILKSPLVLVPVNLAIESASSPFMLSIHEDEIVVNPSLVYKFENDFGILLPEFDSATDNIMSYLDSVAEVLDNGWRVVADSHLTILSFLKINMYKDLDKHEEKLSQNLMISALAGESDAIAIPAEFQEYDHDNKSKPIDTYQVVDADSSQQDAVVLSKSGVSFVLQGPPGTGKSQTITNIISEALADGKKVLFVSEKMAALQVVHNRLAAVGLADFCFALHSHKAKKKDILRDLANSTTIDRKRVRDEALSVLDTLERKRSMLNEYQAELHTPCSGLNRSIFEINGRLAKLSKVPDVVFEIKDVEKMTMAELNDKTFSLSQLIKTLGQCDNDFDSNVWQGATVTALTNELRHNIDSYIPHLTQSLDRLNTLISQSQDEYKIDVASSIIGAERLSVLLSFVGESPTLPRHWVVESDLELLKSTAQECKSISDNINLIKTNKFVSAFDKEVLSLDISSLLMRFRSDYNSALRVFNKGYREDVKIIRRYVKGDVKADYKFLLEALNHLRILLEKTSLLKDYEQVCLDNFEHYYKGDKTDWNSVVSALTYATELKRYIKLYNLPNGFVDNVCSNKQFGIDCKERKEQIDFILSQCSEARKWVFGLFDGKLDLENNNLAELAGRLVLCAKHKDKLEQWVDYQSNKSRCQQIGLEEYVAKIEELQISSDFVVDAYLKRFYRLWLDAMHIQFPSIQSFRGHIQDDTIKEFKELDRMQFKIARSRVRERVVARIPDFNAVTTTRDEIGILKRELGKQRKLMPLRKLFKTIPNLITALRPCFMMSPLSVSLFLEADSYEFDLVIFDEASQVHTEDAIGAIMRGKQVIIVGDTKQLPPTNFFAASISDEGYDTDDESEDDDAGAYQSILDESAAVLPERSLRWHYRSRHEDLIAFSNAKIYNSSLITFPSSVERMEDCGVEYIHVRDGVYDRGKKRCNMVEAKRVAALILEHYERYPKKSLGVVTFSEAQMQAVDTALRHLRQSNPSYDNCFSEDNEEAFFIKNIENVQGDERDTIIFSIGYARDVNGTISMNFGALNKEGGHRRLNVAITRAKHNIKLVGSIVPTDIDLEKTSAEGVRLLRSYIEFAQQGVSALQKELAYNEDLEFDSPFEEAVYDFLVDNGYNVTTQVGCSGFRIDMAVKHPQRSGVFAIGIECDGATYHSSRTARERDRLRQDVLESMGWTIHRIWSTDWIKDQKSEEQKLLVAIEKALSNIEVEDVVNPIQIEEADRSVTPLEIDEVIEQTEFAGNGYGFIPYEQANLYAYSDIDGREVVRDVIRIEQPIHFEELCRRTAPLMGNQKATSKVRNTIEHLFKNYFKSDVIRKGDFIQLHDFESVKVRVANPADSYIRNIAHICDEELAMAMLTIAKHSFGITPNDLFVTTARELGFKRTSDNISTTLRRIYAQMLAEEKVREVDGKVNLV